MHFHVYNFTTTISCLPKLIFLQNILLNYIQNFILLHVHVYNYKNYSKEMPDLKINRRATQNQYEFRY